MSLTLELSDAIERELKQAWGEPELTRRAEEALVLAAYQEALISRGKVGELLGMSFGERERFLAERAIPYNYSPDDLEQDLKNMDRVMGRIG